MARIACKVVCLWLGTALVGYSISFKMKYKEIQLLSSKECNDKLKQELDYLVKLRLAHSVAPIEHPVKIRETRKCIARLKTAQNSCASNH